MADFDAHFPDKCIPFEGGSHLLRELRAMDIRTGLITNGSSHRQRRKVRQMELEPLLDVITISEEAGMRKPEPGIFHNTLAQVGVDPEEAMFVGDDPWSNIGGARSSGMRAIWMRTPFWPEPPDKDAVNFVNKGRVGQISWLQAR